LNKKKVLIAPLNWGLGHATRCIPIINELLRQGADVILASDGAAYHLLKAEYPTLPIYTLPAYNIRYPFQNMMLSMALQIPKILSGYILEHIWLRRFIKKNAIDIVISDNRYGLYNRNVHTIFMTHQLNIQTNSPFWDFFIRKINHFFIKKFDTCWIPDFEKEPSLAGSLSHGHLPNNLKIKYLGPLSRFIKKDFKKKYKAIIVLSGPEPQRSILEKKIIAQLEDIANDMVSASATTPQYEVPFILVRGLPDTQHSLPILNKIEIYNFLTTNELNQKIQESELMICRSGYTTIMDLVQLQAKAILIPTPGQTEQIYLAHILEKNKLYYTENQNNMSLKRAFDKAEEYTGFDKKLYEDDTISKIVTDLLKF
jgi:uncharacterized protein (TIGR00661 family)